MGWPDIPRRGNRLEVYCRCGLNKLLPLRIIHPPGSREYSCSNLPKVTLQAPDCILDVLDRCNVSIHQELNFCKRLFRCLGKKASLQRLRCWAADATRSTQPTCWAWPGSRAQRLDRNLRSKGSLRLRVRDLFSVHVGGRHHEAANGPEFNLMARTARGELKPDQPSQHACCSSECGSGREAQIAGCSGLLDSASAKG